MKSRWTAKLFEDSTDADSPNASGLLSSPAARLCKLRSRSHYFETRRRRKSPGQTFEPVAETREEHCDERKRRLPLFKCLADLGEDSLLRSGPSTPSPRPKRARSSDLPKVPESAEEHRCHERKTRWRYYAAPSDRIEDGLARGGLTASHHSIASSGQKIEENEEESSSDKPRSCSLSGISGSQRRLRVDELDEEKELALVYRGIQETVEEAEGEDEGEKAPLCRQLSRARVKTHDLLQRSSRSDLVCNNLVPLNFAERTPLHHPPVPQIDEEMICPSSPRRVRI